MLKKFEPFSNVNIGNKMDPMCANELLYIHFDINENRFTLDLTGVLSVGN